MAATHKTRVPVQTQHPQARAAGIKEGMKAKDCRQSLDTLNRKLKG